MKDRPTYYAVIPAPVRYDDAVSANAKLLYGEITALCQKEGYCWASNKYFADLYDVNPTTISGWIAQLQKSGHIEVKLESRNRRTIEINGGGVSEKAEGGFGKSRRGVSEKAEGGVSEKAEDNNTSNNNPKNNTTKNNRKSKIPDFSPDSLPYRLSEYLFEFMRGNDPDAKEPNFQKWAVEMERLIRIDKRSEHDIRRVIEWCQKHGFWRTNILSASTLRKHFPRLKLQMENQQKQSVLDHNMEVIRRARQKQI